MYVLFGPPGIEQLHQVPSESDPVSTLRHVDSTKADRSSVWMQLKSFQFKPQGFREEHLQTGQATRPNRTETFFPAWWGIFHPTTRPETLDGNKRGPLFFQESLWEISLGRKGWNQAETRPEFFS